ncbi:MAG: hypothetical protein EOO05_14270 [Chitinophagaceae bacterium]|nr:MAG: hypothetical protein EOO05_14270 [Chitinophagaceae bacterium]
MATSLKNKEKRKKLAHIFAGFVILIHAWEKYESGHGPYLFFLIAGLVFLTVAFMHHVIERKAPWIDGVFFLIEASLSFLIAYEYFHMGKKGLPFVYVVLGIAQIVVASVMSRKGINHHRKKTVTNGTNAE